MLLVTDKVFKIVRSLLYHALCLMGVFNNDVKNPNRSCFISLDTFVAFVDFGLVNMVMIRLWLWSDHIS